MRCHFIFFVIVLMLFGPYIMAQDVPLNLQAKLILKILSMDRNFSRFGNPIKIGSSSKELLLELETLKGKLKVKGKDFVAVKISSPDDIANFKVAYIGQNWTGNYNTIFTKAIENQCLIFCQTEDGVLSGGGAVSFKVVIGKPKIVINLKNAKKQGTDFPEELLKISELVGNN